MVLVGVTAPLIRQLYIFNVFCLPETSQIQQVQKTCRGTRNTMNHLRLVSILVEEIWIRRLKCDLDQRTR